MADYGSATWTTYTTDNTNGTIYYEGWIPPGPPSGSAIWIGGYTMQEPEEMEDPRMRYLYDVFVVDPEQAIIVWSTRENEPIIARSEEAAKLKAVSKAPLTRDVDEYDILVEQIGGKIRPKKEVQEVRVIE